MDTPNEFFGNENELKEFLSEMGIDLNDLEDGFNNYTPKKDLLYEVLNENATIPSYNYESDSGFDLHSTENITIPSFGRALIPTGLKFDIPDGYEIEVRSKSGLAVNQGLFVLNSPGTIDLGYNGEIKVILFNTNSSSLLIQKGMKVAQAVLSPVVSGKWVNLMKTNKIEPKDRNENGFGSTGL